MRSSFIMLINELFPILLRTLWTTLKKPWGFMDPS